ncbi:hypothetical protein [Streptomyces carpinensis]|uniref:Uncharacterized protein n=1 Tax=Streptomyces carpinensis TaxID=66369 RepID=A0ABV1WEU6_9ACTN|nr:hypothetical protein [Streptomyces carpinensis]
MRTSSRAATSEEAVRRALLEIARLLEQDRPGEPMTEAVAQQLADDQAQGEPNLSGGVLAMLPPVDGGVTRGEYGARLREAVAR